MRIGTRRDRDNRISIGLIEDLAPGRLQVEIGQPIVNEVDGSPVRVQTSIAQHELIRAGDDCIDSLPLEQSLEQKKFRAQKLRVRVLIDDGDAA